MSCRSRAIGLALLACLGVAVCLRAAGATYDISLDVDYAAGSFRGEEVLRYVNETDIPQEGIFFRLYANAASLYGSAAIEVTSAQVDGQLVTPSLFEEDTVLFVPLPVAAAPGDSVQVDLVFRGHAAHTTATGFATSTEYGLLAKSSGVLTLTAFYPALAPYTEEGWDIDPPTPFGDLVFSDAATYAVSLVTGADVTVIPAADTSTLEPDGRTRRTFVRDGIRDFPLVLSGDGREPLEATASGVTVRAWFSPLHGSAATVALGRGAAAVDVYTALFGPLPYATVDIVEAPLQGAAGVECSGLFLVAESNAANPGDPFFDIIVAHEMAHQWFYAAVGSDPIEEPWLDEALATYASNVFLAVAVSETTAQSERAGWATHYERAKTSSPTVRPTSPVYDFPDITTYSLFVYSGGALDLEALRLELGDDAFFAGLADYYMTERLRIATASDLMASFQRACSCWPANELFETGPLEGP